MASDTAARERQGLAVRAREKHEQMKQLQAERDGAIRAAVAAGVTLRDLSDVVGLSHQRISQIVDGAQARRAGALSNPDPAPASSKRRSRS